MYNEPLQRSESFCYLGVPFTVNGIDFPSLIRRNGDKAVKSAMYFNSLGCNGLGFDLTTCLYVFQTFVRPILEYGLALCPMKWKNLAEKYLSQCLRVMTGCGKNVSTLTVGMFGEVLPAELRMKSLQFKSWLKFKEKGLLFSVHYAKNAFEERSLVQSCFKTFSNNPFVMQYRREGFAAQLERREPEFPKLKAMKDVAIADLLRKKSSCFIFREKDYTRRKRFRRSFQHLSGKDQRLVANWVLNRSIGPWRMCRVCHEAPESKVHIESCYGHGLIRPRNGGPSRIEEMIAEVEDHEGLERLVRHIRAMIGDRPVGNLGAGGG
jgi:hypothetical protein